MNPVLNSLKQAAIDWRLVMMGTVLAAIALVFNVLSGGLFLSPENLYNIAQQTAVVGVVATVVVLAIVARHIDLSVGSVMGFVGVLIATLMYTGGWHWVSASLAGLAVAIAVSLYQGALTAKLGVPSFVVTLGGLMSFRGAAFLVADGKTQPVNDQFFQRLGGGFDGAIGVNASWMLAAVIVLALVAQMWAKRRAKASYGVPNNPMWLDAAIVLVPVAIVVYAGIRLAPMYLNYFKVSKAMFITFTLLMIGFVSLDLTNWGLAQLKTFAAWDPAVSSIPGCRSRRFSRVVLPLPTSPLILIMPSSWAAA